MARSGWKKEVEREINFKIRKYFPETIINDIVVRELQLDVHRILRYTEFIRALDTVLAHNFLPLKNVCNSCGYRVVSRTRAIIYEIVKKSTVSLLTLLTRNILLINISDSYFLKITLPQNRPELLVREE